MTEQLGQDRNEASPVSDHWDPCDPPRISLAGSGAAERRHAQLVVGYGPRETSGAALEVAADLARRLQAHLHVVHVVDLADYPIDPDAKDWGDAAKAAVAREHEEVREALEGHVEGWTYHAAYGRPADLLIAVADERDALMVVVGSRGEGLTATLGRFMGGSISHGLIHHCARPVLVVPGRKPVPPATRGRRSPFRHHPA